ncbi:MAG: dihydrodipicolinate synthase family protein [Lentisphaeria bacterium]
MKKKTVSASVTPLLENGDLDVQGLQNIFSRNIKHGIDGFFILGSMGEWGSFSNKFKEKYVEIATEIINKKAKLLVGINATSLGLSLKNMQKYKKYDFDYYVFMLPGATSSLDPVKSILTVLDKADRPVYFYYCPPNNNITLSLDQFAAIMKHPNLKGIKNSSSNMWLRRELLVMKKEQDLKPLLFEGQEWADDEALMAGCDGIISGMGALSSKMLVALAHAADNGDFVKARHCQNRLIHLFHGIYGIDLANVYNGQKYALMKMGLMSSPLTLAQEMDSLTPEAKQRIDQCLAEMQKELD